MTAGAIVYGNVATPDGATGWRVIAASRGMSPGSVATFRTACDRFALTKKADVPNIAVWGGQERATAMVVCTERRATDAFGRPGGWLFFGIVCANDSVSLGELIRQAPRVFKDRSEWIVPSGTFLKSPDLGGSPKGSSLAASIAGESQEELQRVACAVASIPSSKVSFAFPLQSNDSAFSVVGMGEDGGRMKVRLNMTPSPIAARARTFLGLCLVAGVFLSGGAAVWFHRETVQLEQELVGSRAEFSQLRDDLTTARDVCVSLQQERDRARQEATEAEARNRELTREKEGLREELAALEEQIRQGESNEARKQMVERQSKDLEKAKEDLADFEKRMVNIHRLSSPSEPEPKPHWTGRLLPSNRP